MEYWRVKREMEELVARKGGRRIAWMRGILELGDIGLEGMEVENFDELWRVELLRLRREGELERKREKERERAGAVRDAVVESQAEAAMGLEKG
jgi:hypothetical protein